MTDREIANLRALIETRYNHPWPITDIKTLAGYVLQVLDALEAERRRVDSLWRIVKIATRICREYERDRWFEPTMRALMSAMADLPVQARKEAGTE